MQKVVIHGPGSYDKLRLETFPRPTPGPGEVHVKVEAIGVNYADCCVRMGLYKSAKDYVGWPITPGFEVAGLVEAVGEGVTAWQVGAEVLAVSRFDGYSTDLVVPEDQVFERPEGFSAAESAGFPAVFLTAAYALYELGAPRKGQRMLVHSAAGGVGGALVQLGKAAGCQVLGVVGASHKVDYARSMGADAVIDKSSQELWRECEKWAPRGFDMVFDANGVATLKQSYEHLAAPGRLIIYGFHTMLPRRGGKPNWLKLAWSWLRTPRFDPLTMTSDNRSVLAFNLSYLFEEKWLLREHMTKLLALVREGQVRAPRVEVHDFAKVGEAHKRLESGQTLGKLVLTP